MLEVLTTAQTGWCWHSLIWPLKGKLMPKVLGQGGERAAIMANMWCAKQTHNDNKDDNNDDDDDDNNNNNNKTTTMTMTTTTKMAITNMKTTATRRKVSYVYKILCQHCQCQKVYHVFHNILIKTQSEPCVTSTDSTTAIKGMVQTVDPPVSTSLCCIFIMAVVRTIVR